MAKVSFKEGTQAQKARSVIAEDIKENPDRKVVNPFAIASWQVKRMSAGKRATVARRK